MNRCAIVDRDRNIVVNVVDYQSVPSGTPPGFDGNVIAVASATAGPGWRWDGSNFYDPTPPLSDAEIAARAAVAARVAAFLADSSRAEILDKIQNATLAQIDTWVSNNVNSLADARVVLAKIIKVLALNISH